MAVEAAEEEEEEERDGASGGGHAGKSEKEESPSVRMLEATIISSHSHVSTMDGENVGGGGNVGSVHHMATEESCSAQTYK